MRRRFQHGLTDSFIHEAHRHAREARDADSDIRHDSYRGRNGALVQAAIDMAEVGGTTFGWGVVHGRFGVISPMGVSLDLIVGTILGVAGAMNVGGSSIAPHILQIGTGSLASFLGRKGVQLGVHLRAGAPITNPELPGAGIFGGEFARLHGGMPVANSGASITDGELAAMAQAARR